MRVAFGCAWLASSVDAVASDARSTARSVGTPHLLAKEHDRHLRVHLARLLESHQLEELIHRAETARRRHERCARGCEAQHAVGYAAGEAARVWRIEAGRSSPQAVAERGGARGEGGRLPALF